MNLLSRSDDLEDVDKKQTSFVFFDYNGFFVNEEARESETVKELKLVPEERERPKTMV